MPFTSDQVKIIEQIQIGNIRDRNLEITAEERNRLRRLRIDNPILAREAVRRNDRARQDRANKNKKIQRARARAKAKAARSAALAQQDSSSVASNIGFTIKEEEIIVTIQCLNLKKSEGRTNSAEMTLLKALWESYPELAKEASRRNQKDYDKRRRGASSAAGPTQRGLPTAIAKRPAAPVQQPQSGSSSSDARHTHKKSRTATADRPAEQTRDSQHILFPTGIPPNSFFSLGINDVEEIFNSVNSGEKYKAPGTLFPAFHRPEVSRAKKNRNSSKKH